MSRIIIVIVPHPDFAVVLEIWVRPILPSIGGPNGCNIVSSLSRSLTVQNSKHGSILFGKTGDDDSFILLINGSSAEHDPTLDVGILQ